MSEKDRKEFREKKCNLLLEAFQSQSKLDALKPEFIENFRQGMGLYIYASVDAIKKTLKKNTLDATVKFRALMFLKEGMDTKQKPMAQYVVTKILSRLKEIAKISKKPNDKKKIFSKDSKPAVIEEFYQLLIECLKEWEVMFPIESGTQCDPSQFKKTWSELLTYGIRCDKSIYFKQRVESVTPPREPTQKPQHQKPQEPKPTGKESKKQDKKDTKSDQNTLQVPVPVSGSKPQANKTQNSSAKNPELKIQVGDLRDGAISYFSIMLEMIAEPENAQMIFEMSPELQLLVSPITEKFIDSIIGVSDIPENWVEEIVQIKQLADEMISDIGKVAKKNTLFPTFQNKYTKLINKLIKQVQLNEEKVKKQEKQEKSQQQSVPPSQPVHSQPDQPFKDFSNPVFPSFPEPQQQPEPAGVWGQTPFASQWQPDPQEQTEANPPQGTHNQFQTPFPFGNDQGFQQSQGNFQFPTDQFGKPQEEQVQQNFQPFPQKQNPYGPAQQNYQQQAPNDPSQQNTCQYSIDLYEQSRGQLLVVYDLLEDPENFNIIHEQVSDLQNAFSTFSQDLIEYLQSVEDFPRNVIVDLGKMKQIVDELGTDVVSVNKKPSLIAKFQKKYLSLLAKFLKLQPQQTQMKEAEPQPSEQPWQAPIQWQPEPLPEHQNFPVEGNPFEQQLQQMNQFGAAADFGNGFVQQDFGQGFPPIENQFGSFDTRFGNPDPGPGRQTVMPKHTEQPNIQKTESNPMDVPENEFQLQYTVSKDPSATPNASYIRSQAQPFSNIFEIDKATGENTEKRIRIDSLSEIGNNSQYPQEKNFGFEDFQEFNLQNIGASVSSQKQISQVERNHTRNSNESPKDAFNFFGEPVYKSKKSASVLDFNQGAGDPDTTERHSVDERRGVKVPNFKDWSFPNPDPQQASDNVDWGAKQKSQTELPLSTPVLPNMQPIERQQSNRHQSIPSQESVPSGGDQQNKGPKQAISDRNLNLPPREIVYIQAPAEIQKPRPIVKDSSIQVDFSKPKPVTKDSSVQVEFEEEKSEEFEVKYSIFHYHIYQEQERRHQSDIKILRQEILNLRHQRQSDEQHLHQLKEEIATLRTNETFLAQKHQQTLEQAQKMLSQFSAASQQLNKARTIVKTQNEQLANTEIQNKDLRESIADQIRINQSLNENNTQTTQLYNNLLRAAQQLQKMRCSCSTCSISQYLAQVTANATHLPPPQPVEPESQASKPTSSVKLARKRTIEIDYGMFIKVHRISQEPLSSQVENLKYACLLNRGVLFENAYLQVGVITQYGVEKNEFQVLLNLYNKSPSTMSIEQSTVMAPSKNLLDSPVSIKGSLQSKQAVKHKLKFSFVEEMEVPLFAVQINSQIYKIVLPVIDTKFCSYQQCDQAFWVQNWRILKQGNNSTLQVQLDKPNPKLMRSILDLKRYWNELVEIRSSKNKMNVNRSNQWYDQWTGLGLIGRLNNMFEFALKIVESKNVLRIRIQAHPSIDVSMNHLLQTLMFLLS